MAFLHILGEVMCWFQAAAGELKSGALCKAGQNLQGFARCVTQSKVCIPVELVTVLAKMMCHSTVCCENTDFFSASWFCFINWKEKC